MTKDTTDTSLFEDYRHKHPELETVSTNGIPTPEGEAAFDIHLRDERTRQLSGILGDLAVQRSDKPLKSSVTVVETLSSQEDARTHWALRQAATGVIDHLIASEKTTPDEVTERTVDGIRTHEAKLAEDNYVRVQLGIAVARVVLSPRPHM